MIDELNYQSDIFNNIFVWSNGDEKYSENELIKLGCIEKINDKQLVIYPKRIKILRKGELKNE